MMSQCKRCGDPLYQYGVHGYCQDCIATIVKSWEQEGHLKVFKEQHLLKTFKDMRKKEEDERVNNGHTEVEE